MPKRRYLSAFHGVAVIFATALCSCRKNRANAEPALSAEYTSTKEHPRVFLTPRELQDLVTRVNRTGSFSARIFAKLSD
jgi:hypothetical protein